MFWLIDCLGRAITRSIEREIREREQREKWRDAEQERKNQQPMISPPEWVLNRDRERYTGRDSSP